MAASLMMLSMHLQPLATKAVTPRDTADYPADPRVAVVEFYQHIRAGEAEPAWKCWDADLGKGADHKYEEAQVRNTIAQWIAQFRLEQALEKKLPEIYAAMKGNDALTPIPEQIQTARFTTFRRLAIVRWSDDEDAALPLELDTGTKPPKWFISLRHYRGTTRASVGDAFRTTGLLAQSIDDTTKDVLAGKVKTGDDLQAAQMRHLDEQLKKLPKDKE